MKHIMMFAIIVAFALTAATIILVLPDDIISKRGIVGNAILYTTDVIVGLFALGMWIGIYKQWKPKE